MSFCVKCGLEYDEKSGNNFCGKCGFELSKDASVQSEPLSTTASAQSQSDKRPIAGIIVAVVSGIIGLLWSFAILFHSLYGSPSSIQIALQQTFPSLQIKTYIGLSLALVGNAALLVGGLMAYFNHPAGAKTVRIAAYFMIAATALLAVFSLFATVGAESWPTLDSPTKGALVGGLIGGVVGAVLQWGLVLFLFRGAVKTKSKTRTPVLTTPLTPLESFGNFVIGLICAGVTVLCVIGMFACISEFDRRDTGGSIGGFVFTGIFACFFGWLTYKCFRALAR